MFRHSVRLESSLLSLFALISLLSLGLPWGLACADEDADKSRTPNVPFTPILGAGAGTETNASQGGTDLLIKAEIGFGTGAEACPLADAVCLNRVSQWLFMHIDGEVSYTDEGRGYGRIPYMNVRVTPASFALNAQKTQEVEGWIGRYGIDKSLRLDILPGDVRKDPGFKRDLSVRAYLAGIDGAVQSFPTRHLGIYVQAAANLIGLHYVDKWSTAPKVVPDGAKLALGTFGVQTGLVLAMHDAFVARLTGGVQYSLSVGTGNGQTINDLDLFAAFNLSVSRLVELSTRIARTYETFDFSQSFYDTRVTSGLTVKWDFTSF